MAAFRAELQKAHRRHDLALCLLNLFFKSRKVELCELPVVYGIAFYSAVHECEIRSAQLCQSGLPKYRRPAFR